MFWNYICYIAGSIRDIYANLFNKRIWCGKGEGEIANFSQFSTISISPDKVLARGISDPYGDLWDLGEHLCGSFIVNQSKFLSLLAYISSCCPSLFQKMYCQYESIAFSAVSNSFLLEIFCSRFFCRVGHSACNVSNTSLQSLVDCILNTCWINIFKRINKDVKDTLNVHQKDLVTDWVWEIWKRKGDSHHYWA